MDKLLEFFKKEYIRRISFLIIAVLLLMFMFPMLDLVILTFLFTYLLGSIKDEIEKFLNKFVKIHSAFITSSIYLIMFTTILIAVYKYFPLAIKEGSEILNYAAEFNFTNTTMQQNSIMGPISQMLDPIIKPEALEAYKQEMFSKILELLTDAGKWGFNIFIALVLSLFFNLEKHKIKNFFENFKESKISWAYDYFLYFGRSFLNSFGKVMNAQIMIATVNTILSIAGLMLLGFPALIALGFMIFVLSLIPVAGVIISLVPLSMIAFKLGGIMHVLLVLLMIALIHAVESYFLNPKFMADKTELPVFLTFLILIISEHFLGIWGLLIGIPLFIFLLDIANVKFTQEHKGEEKPSRRTKREKENGTS